MNKQHIALLDLDGCLFDSTHRTELFDSNHEEFMRQAVHDRVIEAGRFIYGLILSRVDVLPIFITGRDERQRTLTINHLAKVFGPRAFTVLMRPSGDMTPSAELKLRMMIEHKIDPAQVIVAFDDDTDVVAMYRELNIVAYHTAEEGY